jgi:ATP-dependent helicase YprA (DUF1998 family)
VRCVRPPAILRCPADGRVGVHQVRPLFGSLLRLALRLVEACACAEPGGCPACLQTSQMNCGLYNEGLDKAAAVAVLRATLVAEEAEGLQG